MNELDDDRPLGVPVMNPRFKGEATPPPTQVRDRSESIPVDQGRHPDDEPGLPKQLPSGVHAPTQQELAAVEAGDKLEARRLYDEALQAGLGRFSSWGRWFDRTLLFAILAIAALLALFVFDHTFQILSAVASQPQPLRGFGYAGLGAILAVLTSFAIRLLILFLRLRVNQQISATQLRELSSRAELRDFVRQDKALAKQNLETYLRSYPFDQGRLPVTPVAFQFDKETAQRLRGAREYLLDQERFSDYDGWFEDFRARFQDVLQGPADKIVQDWTKLVGLKTAISTSPLIDSVVVLYCGYGMIGDLCRLYNLRMTRPGIIRLMAFTLFNSYVAGEIEEHAEELTASAVGFATHFAEGVLGSPLAQIEPISAAIGKGLTAGGRRVADGLANALLMRKPGRTTIAMLRPINPR